MKSLILLFTSLLVLSCADKESPRLMAPPLPDPKPQPKVKGEATSTGLDVVYNPRVDILFIIDNSRSMEEDILTLQSNIQSFVEALSQNTIMDYHIAATTIFDSSRYTNDEDGVFKIDPNDGKSILYLDKGELIPLKNNSGERMWNSPRYVTKSTLDYLPSLFQVMKYDQQYRSEYELLVDYESKNIKTPESESTDLVYSKVAYGPEYEESLSPIQGAIWPETPAVAAANSGFLREDSLLVIIPLTDADSEEDLNPQSLFESIVESRSNDVLVVGLLCPKESTDFSRSRECRRKDPSDRTRNNVTSFEPESRRIRQFIEASRQALPSDRDAVAQSIPKELDIGSSTWGEKLAEIGNDIKKRVLKKEVYLGDETRPQFDPHADFENDPYRSQGYLIEVFYGDTMLPNNRSNGWFYDARKNTVMISENIDPELLQQEDAQISVHFIEYREGQDSQIYSGPAIPEQESI